MFFKKSIPLTFGAVLRFSIFLAISKLFLEQDAAAIFVSASLTQILMVVTAGRIAAAKAEAIKHEISCFEFNYLYKKSILRLLVSFLVIIFTLIIVGKNGRIDLNWYIKGGLLGLFFLLTNAHQIASEVQNTSLKYYSIVTAQLSLVLLSVIILNDFVLVLLAILTLEFLWLFSLRTKNVLFRI